LTETQQHWSELRALLTAGRIAGPQVHDARIAALCSQHGVRELWSADRDFSRFAKLNVLNPLVA
jgi:predicted nucleic acid-binding protein